MNNIIVLLLIFIILSSMGCVEKPEEKYSDSVEKITIAGAKSGALVYIAKDQGFFEKNGLSVTIKDHQAGKLAMDAFLAGEADIATSAEFVFVSESFKHDDLRIFGVLSKSDITKIAARRDKGIVQPTDLEGKKIGVTRKSAGEFYLGTFLTLNGLTFNDVEIVDLKPNEIEEAISKGEIDAGMTWEPHIHNIKTSLQDSVIIWPGQSGQDFYFILIIREEWLNEHADTVERFMHALIQAEQIVKENDEQAAQIIADRFQLSPQDIQIFWPDHQFEISLPQSLIVAMEDEARWRIENKLTDATEVPNYLDYIYLDALEEVKPEAVSIIG